MKTLIRNARVVLPHGVESVDVLLDGTKIAAIDAPPTTAADDVIEQVKKEHSRYWEF